MEYKVYDSTGNYLRTFKSYKDAETYKIANNRHDWSIKNFKSTTDKQKAAVYFVEEVLYVSFEGDINNQYDVSPFLGLYLDEAKDRFEEIKIEYESYMWDLSND